jgi:uncharacterized membrane protein
MEPQQTNPIPVVPQPKPNHKIFYILIFIFIALVGSSAYLFLQNPKKEVAQSVPIQNEVEEWKTYRNEEYGFEFKYPSDYEITSDLSIKDLGVRVYLNGVKDKGADFFIDAGYQKDVNPSAWFISSAQYDSDVENFDLMSTSTLNINYDKNMVYTKNYLLRNSDKHYSFAYSIHSPVIKDFDKYIKDIKKIISTFKLIK